MSVPKLPAVEDPPPGPSDPWESTVIRDLAVGRTVGEYVIKRRIGAGGMGIVYEGDVFYADARLPVAGAGEPRVAGRLQWPWRRDDPSALRRVKIWSR